MLGFAALSEIPLGSASVGAPEAIIAAASPLGAPAVLGSAQTTNAWAAASTVLGAPSAVGALYAAWSSVPAMLGAPSVRGALAAGWTAAAGPLGSVAVLGSVTISGYTAAASPLGAIYALAYHDFTAQIGDATTRYVMDLATPGGLVRVPISSWQATLRTGASCYVQCVVPAVAEWADSINAATAFTIYRTASIPGGDVVEYEMARSPLEQISMARGPTNYTATLSGYSDAFAEKEDPDATYDRTLAGIRSITTGSGKTRVRCAIDWLLRPGQRAYYGDGASFVVSFINYYVPTGNDAYMDVGE